MVLNKFEICVSGIVKQTICLSIQRLRILMKFLMMRRHYLGLKDKTHLTNRQMELISEEGKQKDEGGLDNGLPAKFVADMIARRY